LPIAIRPTIRDFSQAERDALAAANKPDAARPATAFRGAAQPPVLGNRRAALPGRAGMADLQLLHPLYLVAVWKLDLKSIAMWAWLPFLAADFGSLAAGLLPAWLMKRGSSLLASRKITMTLGALCMMGPGCLGLATTPGMAIALFCIGGFAHQLLNGALITLCADVFDSRTVGTASGMAGTCAWVGGMLFTLLIGQSADLFGYGPLFVALAGLDLVAAGVLWLLLRDPAAGSHRAA
jgi:ACS family hexuronate transporter-like MFS transporter